MDALNSDRSRCTGTPRARTAAEHAAHARAAAAAGDQARAVLELSRALAAAQEEAFASLAQLLQVLRDDQTADKDRLARQASEHQQWLVELHFERGQAYLALGQPAHALADFSSVLRFDPGHQRARLQRGEAHFQLGDHVQASADFRAALRVGEQSQPRVPLSPTTAETSKVIHVATEAAALVSDLSGTTQRAETEVLLPTQSVTAPDGVVVPAEPAVASLTDSGPEDPEYGLAREGNRAEFVVATPDEGVASDAAAARTFYRQGEVARNSGDHAAAIAAYSAALQHDPGYRLAYLNRGQAYRAQRAYDAALADFGEVLRHDPNSAEAHLRRGNVHVDRHDHEAARADYTAALAIDPGLAAAHVNRGLVYAKTGCYPQALADGAAAIQLDPSNGGAYFLRGSAYARLEQSKEALADFDELIRLEPGNALAYNERGLVRVQLAQHDQAVADYTMALRLRPRFALALYNRGVAHRLRGDHAQAIEDLSVILRSKPDHVPALQQRGLAHLAAQNHDQAVADFLAAVQIDPEFREGYQLSLQALQAKAAQPKVAPDTASAAASPQPPGSGFRARRKTALAPVEVEPPAAPEPPAVIAADDEEEPEPSYEEIAAAEAPADEAPDPAHAVAALAEADHERIDLAAAHEQDTETMVQNAGKLKLECPECEVSGLFDFNQLNKLIRCRNCSNFYRVDALGELTRIPPEKLPPGIMVEVRSGIGGWKRHWVPAPGAKVTDLALPKVSVPAAPAEKTKPVPRPRKERFSRFERLHHWFIDFRATRGGTWTMRLAPVVLLTVVALAFAVPLRSSELKQRAEKVAQAWIHKDARALAEHVDPSYENTLDDWLERTPPPELYVGADEKVPRVHVTVEFNDDRKAKVMIRTRARDQNNEPIYFIHYHSWVFRQGKWYFLPT